MLAPRRLTAIRIWPILSDNPESALKLRVLVNERAEDLGFCHAAPVRVKKTGTSVRARQKSCYGNCYTISQITVQPHLFSSLVIVKGDVAVLLHQFIALSAFQVLANHLSDEFRKSSLRRPA